MNKSILSISLDTNIANSKYGDALARQKEYAKYFDNYTIIILNTRKNKFKNELHFNNLHIYSLNSHSKYSYVFDCVVLIKQLNKKYHFDLVSSQDPLITGIIAYLTKLILRIPFNLQLHSTFCFDNNKSYNLLFTILIKFLVNKSDSIRTVFPNLLKSNKYTKHVPVMTDLEYYSKKISEKKEIKKFISVGRLSKEKNFALLINTFSKIISKNPKITLQIVGEGVEKSNLQKLVNRNKVNKNITLVGFKTRGELKNLYKASDAFVLTSNYEGWGLVFLEAASAGLIIISTNVGFVKTKLEQSKSALISEPKNSEQLETNLEKIIENPKMAKKLAETAKEITNNYSKKKLLNDWIKLLQNTK